MKKQNNSSSSKGKGFYLSLLAGVCAVCAIALVLVNISSGQKQNNLVNLNESASNTVKNNKAEAGKNTSNVTGNNNSASKAENQSQVELEGYEAAETMNQPNKKTLEEKKKEEQEKQKAKQKKQVASTKRELTFHKEKGLVWPVNGKVILKYSPDKPVYFSTLEQYKCNPAVILSAKVGESVKAAADGIISKVSREDETGLTVTMSIGSQYSVTYGQLKNVNVKSGQSIKAGQVIGQIAKPSKYYSEEGGNLYFQVNKGNNTIDPLVYLK